MPRFIDHHPTNPNLPPELITLIKQRLRSGEPDEFGETGINVFIGSQGPTAIRMRRVLKRSGNRTKRSASSSVRMTS